MRSSSVGSDGADRLRAGTGSLLVERYELGEQVGVGGMAQVWKARDRLLDRDVAVKLLGDRSSITSFEREARALAAVTHPNVVTVYDIGEDAGGTPFIVMELVDGPNLAEVIASRGPLPLDEALRITNDVLAGLGHAHEVGVVHGDIKPANIILAGGRAKVADLGVARILGTEGLTTSLAATPLYAAPEVLRGQRPTVASDLYSAACVLFETLAGHPPFGGDGVFEVARRHLEDPVPGIRRDEVPATLEEAMRRGMSKEPGARHASASELASAIREVGRTVPVAATSGPETTERLEATERLPGRSWSARWVALLGPLAPGATRLARGGRRMARGWPAWATWTAVAVVAALLVAGVSGEDRAASAATVVPEVRGELAHVAVNGLREAGLEVTGVSYRPGGEEEAGTVLETIPGSGVELERGDSVHLILGAIPVPEAEEPVAVAPDKTPKPDKVDRDEDDDDDDDSGRGRGRGRGGG